MLVAVSLLYEDPNNPRTEFPEAALEELAVDIQQRGILQPLVVHPADGGGAPPNPLRRQAIARRDASRAA